MNGLYIEIFANECKIRTCFIYGGNHIYLSCNEAKLLLKYFDIYIYLHPILNFNFFFGDLHSKKILLNLVSYAVPFIIPLSSFLKNYFYVLSLLKHLSVNIVILSILLISLDIIRAFLIHKNAFLY